MGKKSLKPGHGPLIVAVVLYGAAVGLYLIFFAKLGWSNSQGVWGQFGDFIGGVVNPALGLITVWMLLRTLSEQQKAVRLQRASLAVQRKELKLTRVELKESADALRKQVEQFDKKSLKDDLFARAAEVYEELEERLNEEHRRLELQLLGGNIIGNTLRALLKKFPDGDDPIRFVDEGARAGGYFSAVCERLEEVAGYIRRIDELNNGDIEPTNFYRRRLKSHARKMARCNLLSPETEEELWHADIRPAGLREDWLER